MEKVICMMELFYYQDQNALPSLLGKRETIGKTSQTMETTNSILVLLVKSHHHANDFLESEMEENGVRDVPDFK